MLGLRLPTNLPHDTADVAKDGLGRASPQVPAVRPACLRLADRGHPPIAHDPAVSLSYSVFQSYSTPDRCRSPLPDASGQEPSMRNYLHSLVKLTVVFATLSLACGLPL